MKALMTPEIYKKFKKAGWKLVEPDLGIYSEGFLETFDIKPMFMDEDDFEVEFQNVIQEKTISLVVDRKGVLLANISDIENKFYVGLTTEDLDCCMELINYWNKKEE